MKNSKKPKLSRSKKLKSPKKITAADRTCRLDVRMTPTEFARAERLSIELCQSISTIVRRGLADLYRRVVVEGGTLTVVAPRCQVCRRAPSTHEVQLDGKTALSCGDCFGALRDVRGARETQRVVEALRGGVPRRHAP